MLEGQLNTYIQYEIICYYDVVYVCIRIGTSEGPNSDVKRCFFQVVVNTERHIQ